MSDLPTPSSRVERLLANLDGVQMSIHLPPTSNVEKYLAYICGVSGVELPAKPESNVEAYLEYMALHPAPTPPIPIYIDKNITANGEYNAEDDNADGYKKVTVTVPTPILDELVATVNGEYNPTHDGYSKVTVQVPDPALETLSVTENGEYTPTAYGYSRVTVSVQPPANSYQLKSMTTPTSLATFEASAMPMPTLKASIKAKQASGTLSPSNPLPISGWDEVKVSDVGKNLGQPPQQGVYRFSDGIFDPSNTNYAYSKSKVMGNTQYTVSIQNVGQYWGIVYLDDNENFISSIYSMTLPQTVTTPSNCRYLIAETGGAENPITPSTIGNVQIEAGRTATTYEPYNGVTTTISLGQTVYGGEVDVVNGVLTVDKAIIDLGDMEWRYQSTNARFVTYDISSVSKYPSSNDTPSNIICSCYANNSYKDYTDGQIAQSNTGNVFVKNSNYTDASAFTTAMTGQKLVYELATPIIINLTPSLIKSLNGINNLSVDCGEILEGTYFKAL